MAILSDISLPYDHSYLGNKIAAVAFAAAPLVLRFDGGNFWDRVILGLCGMVGSIIAIFADRPANWKDTTARVGIGFLTCAMFLPWLSRRYNMEDQIDAVVALAAVMGIVSWYLAGSTVRLLQQIRVSNFATILANYWLKSHTGVTLPKDKDEEPKVDGKKEGS